MKTDGIGRIKLHEDDSKYVNVVGSWIYYTNGSNSENYRINTDGTQRQLIN